MNFKKRVNGSWHDIPHYIHNTSADTIATLPAVLYPTGTTATVGLKGNTVQNGTPTPDSPIMPNGTGERTGNLWSGNSENGLLNTDGTLNTPNYNYNTTMYILTEGKNYTLSVVCNYNEGLRFLRVCFYDENKNFISHVDSPAFRGVSFFYEFSFTAPANSKYLRFSYISRNGVADNNIMLNLGSTPLPYENFGIKIPISSANTTTPVYLGEVQTTRKVKKFVLTGEEPMYYDAINNNSRFTIDNAYVTNDYRMGFCSHYKYEFANTNNTAYHTSSNETKRIYILDNNYLTVADFKAYLGQQYAAGTPVTVWYVLATEETAVVNEPLMKIGDYADEVSGISIPVTAGANAFSVDTTVQPSEVTVNYKGWHPVADVHERTNGAWT